MTKEKNMGQAKIRGTFERNDMSNNDWRNEPAPTHRCKVCGALWRYWPKRDTGHDDSDRKSVV